MSRHFFGVPGEFVLILLQLLLPRRLKPPPSCGLGSAYRSSWGLVVGSVDGVGVDVVWNDAHKNTDLGHFHLFVVVVVGLGKDFSSWEGKIDAAAQ